MWIRHLFLLHFIQTLWKPFFFFLDAFIVYYIEKSQLQVKILIPLNLQENFRQSCLLEALHTHTHIQKRKHEHTAVWDCDIWLSGLYKYFYWRTVMQLCKPPVVGNSVNSWKAQVIQTINQLQKEDQLGPEPPGKLTLSRHRMYRKSSSVLQKLHRNSLMSIQFPSLTQILPLVVKLCTKWYSKCSLKRQIIFHLRCTFYHIFPSEA